MKLLRWSVLLVLMMAWAPLHAQAPARWYRGNTHTHTFWSDGNQLPELVADWYKSHGYHFLVLSDHNVLSRGERWKDVTGYEKKYHIFDQARRRFGPDAVVSKVQDGKILVKLKTLEQVRQLVCQPGRFIMIEGDEITGRHQHRPAHANAINVDRCILPVAGKTMAEQLARYAQAVHDHGREADRPVFIHINHPNWYYSNTAEELAAATLADGVEVINPGCNNNGDDRHPSTDQMWDVANTLRLKKDGLPPLFGCATDDTHHYHNFSFERSNPGRAWIMVRSTELTADAITRAMRRGDFYASTGVLLDDVHFDPQARTLTVKVHPSPGQRYRIDFIGSDKDADLTPTPVAPFVDDRGRHWPITARYSQQIGQVFHSVIATSATYRMTGRELYVRARVTNLTAPKKKWKGESVAEQAWTQPVGWRAYLAGRR